MMATDDHRAKFALRIGMDLCTLDIYNPQTSESKNSMTEASVAAEHSADHELFTIYFWHAV